MFCGYDPSIIELEGTWQYLVTIISYNRYAVESAVILELNELPEYLQIAVGHPYLDTVGYIESKFGNLQSVH